MDRKKGIASLFEVDRSARHGRPGEALATRVAAGRSTETRSACAGRGAPIFPRGPSGEDHNRHAAPERVGVSDRSAMRHKL